MSRSASILPKVRHSVMNQFGRYVAIVAIVLAIAVGRHWLITNKKNPVELNAAKRALKERRLSEAEMLARSWLTSFPEDVDALSLLGESLQRQGRLDAAIEIYSRIPDHAGATTTNAQLATTSIFLHQGRLADAERILLKIRSKPLQQSTVDGLWVSLLSLSGRRWESMPFVQRSLGADGDPLRMLIYLANPDEMPTPRSDLLARMFKIRDPLGALGCGCTAAAIGRTDQALELASECLEKRPDLIEASVLKGVVYFDCGELEKFDRWVKDLPKNADEHPSIWFLLGRRAQESGQRPEAIRCYWEVLRRQPNHDRATYQLGQLLLPEGREKEAALFLQRSRQLTRLIELATRMVDNPGTDSENAECARLTYELGRLHESQAWCEYSLAVSPANSAARELLDQLRAELRPDTPWLLPNADLANRIDLSSYPLPNRTPQVTGSRSLASLPKAEPSRISFVDDAKRLGIQFVYYNADDPATEGTRMFEYTGGGVAAFDYDRDGWCDLYFTQGTTWPPNKSNCDYLDQMFRNLAGQQMRNVTTQIGIQDVGFGQGVSAGDYNNDGFQDLYVANVGGNRLYVNNGDGTFADVTQSSGVGTHPHWTTSCMIADLDGDSLPDIYDVTFLDDDDIFTRICRDDDGTARSCAPAGFNVAPDHVYLNQGDGSFRDESHKLGFDVPNGDGLGIVAADFDQSGSISIFIGNDGRANFFFVPETTNGQLHWNEIGVISGLAYNDSGAAQACMGIAAGDVNNDGKLDLFVTNFHNESNTVYINLGSQMFTDRARTMGIHEPSWSMLGFGTQFVDADLDGWEDLILVNGHVDDFSYKQIPYKMRPQFFQNRRTRFAERFANEIGPFFDEPKLGRGMARLDWNRDGKNDVAISHIGDPAAVLTNQSQSTGHMLGLTLVGTATSRDAIGTRVKITAGDTLLTRQLVGGDGYQASNERRLEFGLADHSGRVAVEICWMGGAVEQFQLVPDNGEYLAIEGRGELLRMQPD